MLCVLLKNDVMAPNCRGIRFDVFGTRKADGATEGATVGESKDVGIHHINRTRTNTLPVTTMDHASL